MATKKNVSVYDNVSGGSRKPGYVSTPKKATSSGAKNGMAYKKTATPITGAMKGMAYTRTAINTATGQKTTKSGTLTPVSASEFKSGTKVQSKTMKPATATKMLKKATRITKRKGSSGGGSATRKLYDK